MEDALSGLLALEKQTRLVSIFETVLASLHHYFHNMCDLNLIVKYGLGGLTMNCLVDKA